MIKYQKYLLKETKEMNAILQDLGITGENILFQLLDTKQLSKLMECLKLAYKKSKTKKKDKSEIYDYLYICNGYIGWTDTLSLIGYKLQTLSKGISTSFKFFANGSFVKDIKSGDKLIWLGVTDTYIVLLSEDYCIISEKENENMGLPIDTLIEDSKAFDKIVDLKVTSNTLNSFKALKTLCECFEFNFVNLYEVDSVCYLGLDKTKLDDYLAYAKENYIDRSYRMSSDILRIGFGDINLQRVTTEYSKNLGKFDLKYLDWVLEYLKLENKIEVKYKDKYNQLVFECGDLVILVMPIR